VPGGAGAAESARATGRSREETRLRARAQASLSASGAWAASEAYRRSAGTEGIERRAPPPRRLRDGVEDHPLAGAEAADALPHLRPWLAVAAWMTAQWRAPDTAHERLCSMSSQAPRRTLIGAWSVRCADAAGAYTEPPASPAGSTRNRGPSSGRALLLGAPLLEAAVRPDPESGHAVAVPAGRRSGQFLLGRRRLRACGDAGPARRVVAAHRAGKGVVSRTVIAGTDRPRRRGHFLRLALLVALGAFVAIQLVPYGRDHANPRPTRTVRWDSAGTAALAVKACDDCHSDATRWPWYTNVAPVSWLVQSDVDGAREQLNFSEWDRGQPDVGELIEAIDGGGMPPLQYKVIHSGARLSGAEKRRLVDGLRRTYAADPPATSRGGG
jgi:hypothetical protein